MVSSQAWRVKYGVGASASDPPKGLTLETIEVPAPKRNQVLVKIKAVSLNYRDIMMLAGVYPGGAANPIPTSDSSGEVIEIGEDVKDFKKGDRVVAAFSQSWISGPSTPKIHAQTLGGPVDGVLTQYKIFETEGLVHLPANLTYEDGATLPCAAVTAYRALYDFQPLQAGETVLILGTGGVSMFGLQIAIAAGATVIATSSSDAKLEISKKLGAKHLINYKTHPDWEKEVLRVTEGKGVDKVLEIGGPGTFTKSLSCLSDEGKLYEIGFLAPGTPGSYDFLFGLVFKSTAIQGVFVGSKEDLRIMTERFFDAEKGHGIKPVIDKVFEFKDAPQAYTRMIEATHTGKIVIRVD